MTKRQQQQSMVNRCLIRFRTHHHFAHIFIIIINEINITYFRCCIYYVRYTDMGTFDEFENEWHQEDGGGRKRKNRVSVIIFFLLLSWYMAFVDFSGVKDIVLCCWEGKKERKNIVFSMIRSSFFLFRFQLPRWHSPFSCAGLQCFDMWK